MPNLHDRSSKSGTLCNAAERKTPETSPEKARRDNVSLGQSATSQKASQNRVAGTGTERRSESHRNNGTSHALPVKDGTGMDRATREDWYDESNIHRRYGRS